MTKRFVVLPVLAACAALILAIAGCGGGGSESSASAPDALAPPESGLFVEGTMKPSGSLKTNVESLVENVAGIEDLGETIAEQLEKAAETDGEPFDFSEDVEPWLGEKAGIAFGSYDGANFTDLSFAVQTTDEGEAEEFIETLAGGSGEKVEEGSFEGVDYTVEPNDGTTLGVTDGYLIAAETLKGFEGVVEAAEGESLAEVEAYKSIASKGPDGSLLDVYVNVAGLIEQAGNEVDPQTEAVLEASGIDLEEATALISVIPGSEDVELDLTSNAGEKLATPAAEGLLESLPADSFAAVASDEYGKRLKENIDQIDEQGIPGSVPPNELKDALKKEGIDLDELASHLKEAAAFASGSSRATLGGTAILTTDSPSQAKNTIANIGLLLRANHTPGVTVVSGKASGFSVHNSSLGPKPLVIAAKGERIALGYGLPQTLEGLEAAKSPLSENASFESAKKALGDTPISGFVDGPAALHLAEGLVPSSEAGFQTARPYLSKIGYIGFGTESEGELATLKVIAGVAK
jgi:protein-tyrosine-phosphatase